MPSTDPSASPVPSPLARRTLENGDGTPFTLASLVSDLHRWFFLPGDFFIWALTTHAAPVASFFGIVSSDYGGVLSGFVSSCVWVAAFVALAVATQAVIDFDRRLTRGTQRLFATIVLRARIARTLARQRVRGWLASRKPAKRDTFVSEVEISPAQLQALRLHAKLAPGFLLSVSDAATEAGTRLSAMKDLLDGLQQLGLLERSRGVAGGEDAYALTRAGMALLVSRKLAGTAPMPAERRAPRNI
jgi:DNA-binding MarR family transcriptional regulator